MKDCLFCKFAANEINPLKIYEDDLVLAFLTLENHPVIVPKKHFETVYELDDVTAAAIMKAAVKVSKVVREVYECDGINLVQSNGKASGQEVFHFHLHIKPRWKNDDTTLSWNNEVIEEKIRETKRAELADKLH